MEKFATENLVLLEFLVDRICLDPEVTDNIGSMSGETCVSFQFLDNAPLQVCEEDFTPKKNYSKDNGNNLKNGKSCLFSLTPAQAQQCTKSFDVFVTIFKKMKPGVLPDQIRIGETMVTITDLFNELVESMAAATDEQPVAKTLKDCFKIANPLGDVIGDISVYVRMSCFGKLIVTQFQMNLEDKSVQFKAKEGHYLFKYNKKGGNGEKYGRPPTGPVPMKNMNCPEEVCPISMQQPYGAPQQNLQCPDVSCPPGGGMMNPMYQQQQMYPQQMYPPMYQQQQMMMDPYAGTCMASDMMPMQQPMGGPPRGQCMGATCEDLQMSACLPQQAAGGQQGGNPYQPPPDGPGNYQEIGAQMGPNALTIRVRKDGAKIEKIEDGKGAAGADGKCACTIENFGQPKPKQNRLSLCEAPAGSCAEPQNLAMRPGVPTGGPGAQQQPPFSFKMSGCGRATDNNVVVVPPCSTAPDGTKYTEISDPDRDVFILRIGKKTEGTDKKNNLELELCTPKGPDLKPAPKKETRDTQYNVCDVPAAEKGGKKGGKGKGKGKGKDKKGGKGKGGKGKGKKGGKKGKKK